MLRVYLSNSIPILSTVIDANMDDSLTGKDDCWV
jgi:hypothetical protein